MPFSIEDVQWKRVFQQPKVLPKPALILPSVWLNLGSFLPDYKPLTFFFLKLLTWLQILSLALWDANFLPDSCLFYNLGLSSSKTWESPLWNGIIKNNITPISQSLWEDRQEPNFDKLQSAKTGIIITLINFPLNVLENFPTSTDQCLKMSRPYMSVKFSSNSLQFCNSLYSYVMVQYNFSLTVLTLLWKESNKWMEGSNWKYSVNTHSNPYGKREEHINACKSGRNRMIKISSPSPTLKNSVYTLFSWSRTQRMPWHIWTKAQWEN